jgi:hypothetical protein
LTQIKHDVKLCPESEENRLNDRISNFRTELTGYETEAQEIKREFKEDFHA